MRKSLSDLKCNSLLLTKFTLQRVDLPEPPNVLIANAIDNVIHDISIDTMVLSGSMVVWLRVDGLQSSFDSTGHYPMLAGYEVNERPQYVAAVKIDDIYHFTLIEVGAFACRYTDDDGNERETHNFLVLALRHDPSDATPPYPLPHTGAMDPTGPLHWLKFWPEKDPSYSPDSEIAKEGGRPSGVASE